MKYKFLIILGIILLLVVVLSFLLSKSSQKRSVEVSKSIISQPVSTIAAPEKVQTNKNISFTYSGQQILLPTSLESYKSSFPENLKNNAFSLAKDWGFSTVSNPVPYVYDWKKSDSLLSYNDQDKTISYSQDITSPTFRNSSDVLESLKKYSFLSNRISLLETSKNISSSSEGNETSEDVTVITYKSTFSELNFPIIFSAVRDYSGELRRLDSGKVISFGFDAQPLLTTLTSRPLMSIDEAVKELNNQKGYLGSIKGLSSSEYKPLTSVHITSVDFSLVSVAYLYNKNLSLYEPIFVFSGIGKGDQNYSVQYYLKATL